VAYDDLVRKGVAMANVITKSLHVPVVHRAWIGQDPWGNPIYAPPSVSADGGLLKAVVELKQTLRTLDNGMSATTKAYISFIEPVPANGTAGRVDPIDPRDYIMLPGGVSGPILDIEGVLDPDTGRPYMSEVWLGA
jgi:hypothetical protein